MFKGYFLTEKYVYQSGQKTGWATFAIFAQNPLVTLY
jgi:hypothetical protein